MFQRYVAIGSYVDRGCCTCCKCFRGMLQVFQRFVQNVSSVPDVCCKCSDLDVAYVSHMLQQYVLNVSVVSVLCCSECFHTLQVASVLSGYCICFTHMLQVYVLDISSVFIRILHLSASCYSKSQGM